MRKFGIAVFFIVTKVCNIFKANEKGQKDNTW